MLVEVEHICKSFDDSPVLDDVSFQLDLGQSLAVVAPSGVGKSTLLSIVGLLMEPTSGRVFFEGADTAQMSDEERSALRATRIGFLFQHTQLIGSLRAIENVTLAADFSSGHGASGGAAGSAAAVGTAAVAAAADVTAGTPADFDRRAQQLLEQLDVQDRMYHFPYQMSVGQKRRVATARALLLSPSLIIADEPTNDLDPTNAKRVVDILFEQVKTGKSALLYATHDKELAEMADTVLRLEA